MTYIKNCELLDYQCFLVKMCRLIQLEEFHKSKDKEIERLKMRWVLFHDLKLSICRAHNTQAVNFQTSFQEIVNILQ